MLKRIITLVFIISLISIPSFAVDMITGFDGKLILQDNEKAKFAYEVTLKAPLATNEEKGYQFGGEISYVYCDRDLPVENEVLTEMQAMKTMFTAKKSVPYLSFIDFKLGTGVWIFTNQGDDKEKTAYNVGFSFSQWGFEANLYCDIVKLEGPDLYSPTLGIKILGL